MPIMPTTPTTPTVPTQPPWHAPRQRGARRRPPSSRPLRRACRGALCSALLPSLPAEATGALGAPTELAQGEDLPILMPIVMLIIFVIFLIIFFVFFVIFLVFFVIFVIFFIIFFIFSFIFLIVCLFSS